VGYLLTKEEGNNMRGYHMMGGLALVLLLTMIGLPGLAYAQGAGGLTDFREKSSYSVEDLAQALFAEPAAPVRTRGVGPAQTRPSLPLPQPAVTLNVLFASNSDTLPATSYAEVDKLGTVLSWPQYADYRIRLAGHTDNQGAERKNQVLSERRVKSIKAYLTQHFHIAPERVDAVGYGSTKPLVPNDTPEGRAKNRRVEVVSLGRAQ
jgi:outer membrane protein OmpA-like peptidoglycan-associated protein